LYRQERQTSSKEMGNYGREMSGEFCRQIASSMLFEGIFNMPQICDMEPTALLLRRGSKAEDFFSPWKIRQLRPGSNPRTWVPEASMLTTRPPNPLCLSKVRRDICLAGKGFNQGPHLNLCPKLPPTKYWMECASDTSLNRHQHFSEGMGQDIEITRVQLAIETPSLWKRSEANLCIYGLLTDRSVMMQSGLMVSEHFNKRWYTNKTVRNSQPANLIIY
jgi:hypothetical protein